MARINKGKSRNYELPGGVMRHSRTSMYKRAGLYKKKRVSRGGVCERGGSSRVPL